MFKALVVEDEPHLGVALRIALRRLGFASSLVSSLEEAKRVFEHSSSDRVHWPEILVLDRMLGDCDSVGWCRELRNQGFEGGILILTAKGELHERIEGLRSGADDYLAKPFSWEEFVARLEALKRRVVVNPIRNEVRAETSSDRLWEYHEESLEVKGPQRVVYEL